MIKKNFKFLCIVMLVCNLQVLGYAQNINWLRSFDSNLFDSAKKERKNILLDLEANWCHWCHVMDEQTYSNNNVINYLNTHFIAVKVDQDNNPELSSRYATYGWPAIIFFNANGEDIVKRSGYIAYQPFLQLLKAIVKDPSPEQKSNNLYNLEINNADTQMQTLTNLKKAFKVSLDYKLGALDFYQKYVEYDNYEYALFYSNNLKDKQWINTTATNAIKICDPIWGGVYQYSTHSDWDHPHFEKLLLIQARYINVFTYNYLYHDNVGSMATAYQIINYADRFLARDNLYASSQDADLIKGKHSADYFLLTDGERIKLGTPSVDTNTYTNSNADMISAFGQMYFTTEDEQHKIKAKNIFQKLLERKDTNGLFAHSYQKTNNKSLKDNLAIAKALYTLIKLEQDNQLYQDELAQLLDKIILNFSLPNGSLKSFLGNNGLVPEPIVEENIYMARLLNWYSHYVEKKSYKDIATRIFLFLINPKVSVLYYNEPAILALHQELNSEPDHLVYVDITPTDHFFIKAKAMAPFYSLYDAYDKNLSGLSQQKKSFLIGLLNLNKSFLLACTSSKCSSPMFNKENVKNYFLRLKN